MDTQDSGASTDGADTETHQTDQSTESTDGDTSEGGTQESADNTQKQIADKDRHIVKLEKQNKELKDKVAKSDDPLDTTHWIAMNSQDIKACGAEYEKEIQFFKDQGVKMTVQVFEKALENAKNTKGLNKNVVEETTVQDASPAQGEDRKTQSSQASNPVPDWAARQGWTQEDWDKRVQKTKSEKGGK